MPPLYVLTHAAAALAGAALVWLLLRGRHRQAMQRSDDEIEALKRSLQSARDDVEALRPQAMQALQLETTLTLRNAEHRRIETEITQALDASRRRLAETEAMASSLQQALVDARTELAQLQSGPSPAAEGPAAPPTEPSDHDPSSKLAELRSRLTSIISASRKWQRSTPPR